MDNALTILLMISSGCGAVITIAGFIGVLFKLPMKWLKKNMTEYMTALVDEKLENHKTVINNQFEEIKDILKLDKEATMAELRHSITYIYEKYLPNRTLPPNAKKDLCSLYEVYVALGGNSYVHEIYEDMMQWEVR